MTALRPDKATRSQMMNPVSPIRKIYQGAASRQQMFRLFDRHAQRPNRFEAEAGALYAGEWFEVGRAEHDTMLDILPPLWMRGEMFALREFHAYCDLNLTCSPIEMRDALVGRESEPARAMTHEERLEHIWSSTHDDFRGYAGETWPRGQQGKRTILVYCRGRGTTLKLLDQLNDLEIAAKLPVHLRDLPEVVAA